jgi:replicative DNA helicase
MRKLQTVENLAEVIVAKQRHGATGTVPVRFEGKFTLFSDYIPDAYLPTQMG